MTVIRIKKHETKFVVLQKEILENPKISLKSKGLWAFCMAKPDNWEFHVKQLADTLKEAKDSIGSAIKELEQFGYCRKIQIKDSKGKFLPFDYEIYETSQLKKCLPQQDFPLADYPVPENPQLIKNDLSNHIEKEEREEAPPPPPLFKSGKVIFELSKLFLLETEFGVEQTKAMIARLDDYAHIKPKKFKEYADHYRVLRNWLTDEKEKKTVTSPKEMFKQTSLEIAKKIKELYKDDHKIHVGVDHIEFIFGPRSTIVGFTDYGFRDQVISNLRKMNLPIDGL